MSDNPQPVNGSDVTWLLRDTGLFDAGLSIGEPIAGFTVDQTSDTNATVHYLGSTPERTQARLERAASALEADGYTVDRLIGDSRYYLDITRHETATNAADTLNRNGANQ